MARNGGGVERTIALVCPMREQVATGAWDSSRGIFTTRDVLTAVVGAISPMADVGGNSGLEARLPEWDECERVRVGRHKSRGSCWHAGTAAKGTIGGPLLADINA
jgi:hypothetical protein